MTLRPDQQIIDSWIPDKARILDLGCGDGQLLTALQKRHITGYGIDNDNGYIAQCLATGVDVIHADLDQGLSQFQDKSMDIVILSQTLQAVKKPSLLLDEIMRVGKQAIIGFPNFGYWQCRLHLSLYGKMPVSTNLPAAWFDTPNIHLCTIKDFEQLCQQKQLTILKRSVVNHAHQDTLPIRLAANFFGEIALYHLQ